MSVTLTRSQFDTACKAYVDRHPPHGNDDSGVKRHPSGWAWNEHPYLPSFGYLSRSILLPRHHPAESPPESSHQCEDGLPAEEDEAESKSATNELLTSNQYIVYSATFQVPTFYFTLHDSTGSPLGLESVIHSRLFHRQALPTSDGGTFALTLPGDSFALLSQGEHPTLGLPCWYFHPCHTSEVVSELLKEIATEVDGLRWLEVWFMVMSNVVDFFAAG